MGATWLQRRPALAACAAAALLAAFLTALLATHLTSALARESQAQHGARAAAGLVAQMAGSVTTGRVGPAGMAPYAPRLPELPAARVTPFRAGGVIDEAYRSAFNHCDRTNRFGGRALERRGGCLTRPNRFEAFLRLPGGAVFMEAHLNLDLAGSAVSCRPPAPGLDPDISRCATFLDYESAPTSAYAALGQRWRELFVNGDRTPFVTIPFPPEADAAAPRAFLEKTGLRFGDVGVVFYRDRFAPAIIANAGPAHQALAGSLALFDRLGVPRCRARASDRDPAPDCADAKAYGLGATVVAILFPGSAPPGLTPETTAAQVEAAAFARLEALAGQGARGTERPGNPTPQ